MRRSELLLLAVMLGACADEAPVRAPRQLVLSSARRCPEPAPTAQTTALPPPFLREGRVPLRLDRSGVEPVQLTWEATAIDAHNAEWIGGAGGAIWLHDRANHQLRLRKEGAATSKAVHKLPPNATFRIAVSPTGELALLLGHRLRAQPLRRPGLDRLLRFDTDGRTIEDSALDWTDVEPSRLSFGANGELLLVASLHDGAKLGAHTPEIPRQGMAEALLELGSKGSLTSITQLGDALPGSTEQVSRGPNGTWIRAHLRDSSVDAALIKVDADGHTFSRALRWRNGDPSYYFRMDGPEPLGGGVFFAGALTNLDWGDGAYISEDSLLLVHLDENGNVVFVRSLAQNLHASKVYQGRVHLLVGATNSFEVLTLDSQGTLLSIRALERPLRCDAEDATLYLREGSLGASVQCEMYTGEDTERVATRYFADLAL